MATLIEHGSVPEWGIAQNEDAALLLNSLDISTSITGEHVQKNRFGQTCGFIAYDQESSWNMSGSLVKGGKLAYTLASAVSLNNFEGNNDFVSGLGAGETANDCTSICREMKRTLSSTSAVQVDISGVIYNFASTV